ncbi:Chondroitin proteoglycan 2 [Trichinella papuae]|uniref:Chondroitin proteoglycan 2 n=1 Tax=Trichinella papuae TaxID=268474 RepID=A0A0V1MXC3_9BILA|nr:Chondroitin proteoglycan 2 [Trichinella papuae]
MHANVIFIFVCYAAKILSCKSENQNGSDPICPVGEWHAWQRCSYIECTQVRIRQGLTDDVYRRDECVLFERRRCADVFSCVAHFLAKIRKEILNYEQLQNQQLQNDTKETAPFNCKNMENGLYGKPCSSDYYTCWNGRTIKHTCPANFSFNQNLLQCRPYAETTSCFERHTDTPSSNNSTEKPIYDCKKIGGGSYANPRSYPINCSETYYTCHFGMQLTRHCPDKLVFDPEYKICRYRSEVFECTGKRSISPISEQNYTSTMQPTLPPVDFDCKSKPDGFYADPKYSYSQVFYSCSGGLAREMHCQQKLVYDSRSKTCQSLGNLFTTTDQSLTTTVQRSTGTTNVPTTEELPLDCGTLVNGLYPDPKQSCSHLFYSCANGFLRMFICPEQLYYDPVTQICDDFWNVPECHETSRNNMTTQNTENENVDQIQDEDCVGFPDGRYPYPKATCSNLFTTCSNGLLKTEQCPVDLFYDVNSKNCLQYDLVEACIGSHDLLNQKADQV